MNARPLAALACTLMLAACTSGSVDGAGTGFEVPGSPVMYQVHAASPYQTWLYFSGIYDPDGSVSGIRLYRNGAEIAQFTEEGAEYNDRGLAAGTEYCYEVTAFGPAGESEPSSAMCATTLQGGLTDPCWSYGTCGNCWAVYGCGWCMPTELCSSGDQYGPTVGWCGHSWATNQGTVRLLCGGGGNPACDDCISSCQGVSGCCTGCGCLCEGECGGCI